MCELICASRLAMIFFVKSCGLTGGAKKLCNGVCPPFAPKKANNFVCMNPGHTTDVLTLELLCSGSISEIGLQYEKSTYACASSVVSASWKDR